jgi:hypothetical protein
METNEMEIVASENDPRIIDPVVAAMGCICPDCGRKILAGSVVVPREMCDDDGDWVALVHEACDRTMGDFI